MSTDIEPRTAPGAAAPTVDRGWADGLMAWAEAAQKAHEIALVLCETSFVPKTMAHRPGEVTGAILTGMELGVPIMWALSHIDIVDGVPGIRAKGLRGLLRRHGHEIWVEESTATRAIVCARHKNSQRVERSIWTLDRAKRAELLGKKNWKLYTQDMLLNRATAEAARLAAPDVMFGAAYTIDELGGDESPDTVPASVEERQDNTPAPAPKKRSMRRTPAAPPADVPAPPDMPQPPTPAPTLPDTCDLTMPHDTRYPPPDGCPPNCPTRQPAAAPEEPAPDEALAIAVLQDAGLQPIPADEQPPPDGDAPPGGEPDDDFDTVDGEEMMSAPQRKRIGAEMRRAGLTSRDQRLTFVSDAIGRTVASSNELTMREASTVIQALIDTVIDQGLDRARAETTGEQ